MLAFVGMELVDQEKEVPRLPEGGRQRNQEESGEKIWSREKWA